MKLSDWLGALPEDRTREQNLGQVFHRAYGDRDVSLWRAPGRVNLIGEHTDYNNLPVLPMAIPFDILILFSPAPDRRIRLANTLDEYGPRDFHIGKEIPPFESGDWGNYAKAAVQGIVSHLGWNSRPWVGFDAVVDGIIPRAAGLSSSSAMVVASALAFIESNGIRMSRRQLAELMAQSEWYVGTRGGGMDQAVCLLASAGNALLIHFFPLRVEPVPVPAEAAFVVCDSLVSAAKSREARSAYNVRALEGRLAAGILARELGIRSDAGDTLPRLGDLLAQEPNRSPEELLLTLQQLSRGILWTPRNTARSLGLPLDEMKRKWFEAYAVEMEPDRPMRLLECARHVLSEGERVYRACEALRNGDLVSLGSHMNASHESCAKDFAISTPELDRLVAVACRHGALGSRLTGAGFGGCTVSLVPEGRMADFCQGVARDYYGSPPAGPDRPGVAAGSPAPIYPCHPANGGSRIL